MRPVRSVEVCIDVVDPWPVARFWTDLLGYTCDDDPGSDWVHLEPPAGLPALNLQRVPERKEHKNRLHLDVYVDDPEDWIGQAEDLGARIVRRHEDEADWFCVLVDPAGNEFCICLEAAD